MDEPSSRLVRRLGVPGATVLGLGAMLGTGVFALWAPALALAGSLLLLALLLAGFVAGLNAWSTATLAMANPESGGAYAYGRIYLNRTLGMIAGIAFVVGKTTSAAAAALVIGIYLVPEWSRVVAVAVIVVALLIELRGLHRTVWVSGVLVAIVITVLIAVGIAGSSIRGSLTVLPAPSALGLFAGAALCFFAFAGYARITVLGEEVRQPRRTIPRAIGISMAIIALLYVGIALTVIHAAQSGVSIGPAALRDIAMGSAALVIATDIGVVLAAGAALLALIAGVSRTIFAMAERGDAPSGFAHVNAGLPRRAQVLAAGLAAVWAVIGSLNWALALSAMSVLGYYAIAHLAAYRMPGGPPRWVPPLGFLGCFVLAGALLLATLTGALPRS